MPFLRARGCLNPLIGNEMRNHSKSEFFYWREQRTKEIRPYILKAHALCTEA